MLDSMFSAFRLFFEKEPNLVLTPEAIDSIRDFKDWSIISHEILAKDLSTGKVYVPEAVYFSMIEKVVSNFKKNFMNVKPKDYKSHMFKELKDQLQSYYS